MGTNDVENLIDAMNRNYQRTDALLSGLYDKIGQDPENEELKGIFFEVEKISRGILDNERQLLLVSSYDNSMKNELISRIDERITSSKEAADSLRGRRIGG